MPHSLHDLGEFALIDRLTSGLYPGDGDVLVGVGDDCAVIDDGADRLLLITTDLMAEGVHFFPDADPESIGQKLVAVNVSDVAAMGGEPRHAVIALAVSADLPVARLDGLYRGIRAAARRYGLTLVGGDTTASCSGLVLTLTVLGRVEPQRVLRRDGARPGDRVLVSGTLGDSAAGLALLGAAAAGRPPPSLPDHDVAWLCERHLRPAPRLTLGRALSAHGGVTAAIDVSDGLGSDLGHVCRRSGVGAVMEVAALPLSPSLRAYARAAGVDPIQLAVGGGEDYELCLTADPGAVAGLLAIGRELGVGLAAVGSVDDGEGVRWRDRDGAELVPGGGWDHFHTI